MPSARLATAVEDVPLVRPFEITPCHTAIFDWFKDGEGHLRVEAFAGTGKSSSILRAIDLAPEDNIWLATFAKRNQLDLEDRLTNPKANAQTIHSLGYQAIREGEWGYTKVCTPRFAREDDIASRVSHGLPYGGKRLVGKLFTMARQLTPLVGTPAGGDAIRVLTELATDFDLLPPTDDKLTIEQVCWATLRALELAASEKPQTGIDYADMLFLPLRNGWLRPQFDMVVVDEYQDLTLSQVLFIRATCYGYARIILVGDRNQSIFGFRGAGGSEIAKLMQELQPAELPLPKTYRCPRKVVAIAQAYAPGYEVDASAPEGIVDELGIQKLVEAAAPGNFILSRANAPLMPIALALLRADKPATIRGRDFSAGLIGLVKRIATGHAKTSIPEFLTKLRTWREREVTRFLAMKRDDKVPMVDDKFETLQVLAHSSTSVPHLLQRLDTLFTDEENEGVILSTVHKAKGLEADRVFLLRSTFLRPASCVCGHFHGTGACRRCGCPEYKTDSEKQLEERCIFYVAVTRTRQHLTMVR